jgi:Zn ribbon nucleic-acid-binding protein
VYTHSELARLKKFIEDSKKPHPDFQKYSRLSSDLKLLHLKADHGWSNKSFKHLLDVLRDMLPEGKKIAESFYEAKKIIYPLGIEVEKINTWKNNCVLFRGDYADLDKCPKCGYDQYKRKKDGRDDNNANDENEPDEIRGKKKEANRGAPVRVAWYFCIISQLRRWFAT